jgi:hypothetical protein
MRLIRVSWATPELASKKASPHQPLRLSSIIASKSSGRSMLSRISDQYNRRKVFRQQRLPCTALLTSASALCMVAYTKNTVLYQRELACNITAGGSSWAFGFALYPSLVHMAAAHR